MLIQPKVRGFICTTAHPVGCFQAVKEQVAYVKSQPKINGPKNVLIIGDSTGYGLASRIVSTFAADAKTIGVAFERQAEGSRTASPGWYNKAAFEKIAADDHRYAKSINGDAFSDQIKAQTADLIKRDFGAIDLLIYSLASPRRQHPETGSVYQSVLKPVGSKFVGKTVDAFKGEVKDISIEPANDEEVKNTIAVMGGEDWERWIDYLMQQNLLAEGFKTVAYSYIGPELTHQIYKEGTIGKAKEHLKETADRLSEKLKDMSGEAVISVDKAVVTQASAAIPVVPLYISLLFKIMKAEGIHEGCIEQIYRLFQDHLYSNGKKDKDGYIRIDNLEMREDVQKKVAEIWPTITSENVEQLTDLEGYRQDFYKLFGFEYDAVDYEKEVDPVVAIPSLKEEL